jgi:hypothetical protein
VTAVPCSPGHDPDSPALRPRAGRSCLRAREFLRRHSGRKSPASSRSGALALAAASAMAPDARVQRQAGVRHLGRRARQPPGRGARLLSTNALVSMSLPVDPWRLSRSPSSDRAGRRRRGLPAVRAVACALCAAAGVARLCSRVNTSAARAGVIAGISQVAETRADEQRCGTRGLLMQRCQRARAHTVPLRRSGLDEGDRAAGLALTIQIVALL